MSKIQAEINTDNLKGPNMKKNLLIGLGLMVMVFIFNAQVWAEDGLKEGKWIMTMVTKMDNMTPRMAEAMKQMENMPPEAKAAMEKMQQKMGVSMKVNGQGVTISTTQCITKQNPVPKNKYSSAYCQVTHNTNGNVVNFHTTCDHNNMQMESSGSMTYAGDTMQGHIKSHEVVAGKTMDSSIDITGQYAGPCT